MHNVEQAFNPMFTLCTSCAATNYREALHFLDSTYMHMCNELGKDRPRLETGSTDDGLLGLLQ